MKQFLDKTTCAEVAKMLAGHYEQHKRDLPWRRTNDPYSIWVSEVILQQTRVAQGLPYYLAFIGRFPNIKVLAEAEQEEVLKYWQGLGYYSRARNMHTAAQQVLKKYGGRFPSKYDDLIALKGIGPYTAAAIASISSNEAVATVDGNVLRVLSRIFGIDEAIDGTKGKKIFQQIANELLDRNDPGTHNQALMEFGALTCVPNDPDCSSCPQKIGCSAFRNDRVGSLPVKKKKIKKRERHFHYFHISAGGRLWMKQRTAKDIWQNMYELPMVETTGHSSADQAFRSFAEEFNLQPGGYALLESQGPFKHILTHQLLQISFHELKLPDSAFDKLPKGVKTYTREELTALPKPKPIVDLLKKIHVE